MPKLGERIAFRRAAPADQGEIPGRPIHEWVLPDGERFALFYRTSSGYIVRFPGYADFTVSSDGLDVLACAVPGVDDATVRHIFLGQVTPLALSRAGSLVFHASAVDLGGAGVAFMGASGLGKSTLAASFAASGAPLLADDGLLVFSRDGADWLAPGHPSIRLWEDSRTAVLAGKSHAVERIAYTDKARIATAADLPSAATPVKLRRVYFLEVAATVRIEPMSPADALIALLRHSFLIDVEDPELLAAHFEQLAALARRPIFHRLAYPREFRGLSMLREAIIRHAANP